ncbi:serine/threonine protein kinase [Ectobacillus ponti]|uniref:Serine/threonine protein kinase n=1 Tax=Ectobacillus ponti TaxID=2961894 RepID=A0AA41XAC6_9BACI|nr:serine/threonine protein kinase [Ectobacillus ponti]MCP8969188.1 serine/threonine protein kinase [Ectobacillus ponti]
MNVEAFVQAAEEGLLRHLKIESEDPYEPIEVKHVPAGWTCIGVGNYAAVFTYHAEKRWVVKVYARDYEGIEQEAQVYKQLGQHPAYSHLLHRGNTYLVLKRLHGLTLYETIHRGVRIPEQVIQDIEEALVYARKRGLRPCDVHGKNVMMHEGRGYVVDVSDFYKEQEDRKWRDLVKAYRLIYKPFLYKYPIPVPYALLDFVRRAYRLYRKGRKQKLLHREGKTKHM